MAEWLKRLTRKPKVRTAVGSNLVLDSLVAVRNSSPGRPVPCEGNLVATAGSCGRTDGKTAKHRWPLLGISLSDFHRLATLNINIYLSNIFFKLNDNMTRGHILKIDKKRSNTTIRKTFFSQRVINQWNDLPASIVNLISVPEFEKAYDRHMSDNKFIVS